jgi:V/A-type H+-transporting ATPase subunit D
MSRLALPATKSHWLRLRADLEFLEAGLDLLDQKRAFLSEALLGFDQEAAALRGRVEADLAEAFELVAEARGSLGEAGLARAALAAEAPPGPAVRERSLMGVVVPMLDRPDGARTGATTPGFAPGEAGSAADDAAFRLRSLLPSLAELAELESCCRRLARDLARTRRKLNALERVHIPSHRETIRYMADQLEEREREAMFQLRRVTARKGAGT